MAEKTIDLDRGVIICNHSAGFNVYMYVDTPGVYLNAYGAEVPIGIASEAGFDTERNGKLRQRRERMAKAMQEIEKDLALVDRVHEVLMEQAGLKLVHVGFERYIIEDADGNNLTKQPLTKEQGENLLPRLVNA